MIEDIKKIPDMMFDSNPNLSIILPGGCDAHCPFCFWKEEKIHPDYMQRLRDVMTIPEVDKRFRSLTITGGEPTLSPILDEIAQIIMDTRMNWPRIVLNTNGREMMHLGELPFDHVNLSRHHRTADGRKKIFGKEMAGDDEIMKMIYEWNLRGIDTTIVAVVSKQFSDLEDIYRFVDYARLLNATYVSFRAECNGNTKLVESPLEIALQRTYKPQRTERCPVCMSSQYLINGMVTIWKTGLMETEHDGYAHELIFHPDGRLSTRWGKEKEEDVDVATERKILDALDLIVKRLDRMEGDGPKEKKEGKKRPVRYDCDDCIPSGGGGGCSPGGLRC